jgi:hypothetical protein
MVHAIAIAGYISTRENKIRTIPSHLGSVEHAQMLDNYSNTLELVGMKTTKSKLKIIIR